MSKMPCEGKTLNYGLRPKQKERSKVSGMVHLKSFWVEGKPHSLEGTPHSFPYDTGIKKRGEESGNFLRRGRRWEKDANWKKDSFYK